MPRRQIEWSQLALDQFDELLSYLRQRNPAAARRVGRAIINVVDQIGLFPEAHRAVAGLPPTYREAFVKNYRLLYRLIDDERVRLISIRHTRQRPLTPDEILELER